ncbi:peptidase [Chryseobacterium sp.]|uniref:peptidase n=1 Tax=Chryseobacterium sp. TaxID=1871047 RepID=UPI0025BEA71E|nr:peptidase [Chryseobacterium sp.]
MLHAEIKSLPREDISILVKNINAGKSYLCDCGEASLLTIKDVHSLCAVFISHTHIDHFSNFDGVFRYLIGKEETLVICGPKNIHLNVRDRLKSYTWNLEGDGGGGYEIREIISPEEINIYRTRLPNLELELVGKQKVVYEDSFLSVDVAILDHRIDSISYLFKEKDSISFTGEGVEFKKGKWISELKAAFENNDENEEIEIEGKLYRAAELFHLLSRNDGYKLGVIMDHAAKKENHEKIKKVFQDADKVYIESFYKDLDKELAKVNDHSYASASGQIMKDCNVKEAVPVHFSRRYEDNDVREIEVSFYKAFRNE